MLTIPIAARKKHERKGSSDALREQHDYQALAAGVESGVHEREGYEDRATVVERLPGVHPKHTLETDLVGQDPDKITQSIGEVVLRNTLPRADHPLLQKGRGNTTPL